VRTRTTALISCGYSFPGSAKLGLATNLIVVPFETLTTPRLRLEPWTDSHTGLLVRLAADPAVTRYIGDGAPWPESRATALAVDLRQDWRRHGFGWRAVIETETEAPIGLAALNFAGAGAGVAADEYEIGWWLDPAAWGRGLGREAAAAVRDEGFSWLRAPSVLARIQPANAASLAVAAAVGLTRESESVGRAGEPILVLRLTAERWRTVRAAEQL
jgi:RimJ/RimL family protein N-acetyltransferase